MAAPAPLDRLCPHCRTRTAARLCPADRTATLALGAPADADDLRPGALVADRYRLLHEIGRGGHGTVFEAEHVYGVGRVALKVLRAGDPTEEELLRFHREARVTAGLDHPNTVRVLDFGQTAGGSLYLALELLRGRTLEAELRLRATEGRVLSEAEAVALAEDVLGGLGAAHAAGLVHRDLKPGNILLADGGERPVARILDFGIAQVAGSDLTRSRHTVGTPAYMSPEQCEDRDLDGRSDLYALGVILYRCVAGALPFRASTDMAMMWAQVHQPPPDVASAARVSPGFADALTRALAKRPDDRPATAAAMARALRGQPAGPVDTPRTPTAPTVRRGLDGPITGTATASATALPPMPGRTLGWRMRAAVATGLVVAAGLTWHASASLPEVPSIVVPIPATVPAVRGGGRAPALPANDKASGPTTAPAAVPAPVPAPGPVPVPVPVPAPVPAPVPVPAPAPASVPATVPTSRGGGQAPALPADRVARSPAAAPAPAATRRPRTTRPQPPKAEATPPVAQPPRYDIDDLP